MSLIAKASGDRQFQLPPEGLFQGVCVDVVDMGEMENKISGKMQHKCRVVFQLDEKMDDDRRFIISRIFTVSLNDQSNLLPFLENWRGKRLTPEEKDGFDLETLVGVNGQVQVLYNDSNGQTYANIAAVLPWGTKFGQKMTPDENYVRVKDRPEASGTQQPQRGPAQRTAGVSGQQARQVLNPSSIRPVDTIDDGDEVPF